MDGWHDELGFLTLAAGGIAWVALYSKDREVIPGLLLFLLGAIVALSIWLSGHRQGKAKAHQQTKPPPDTPQPPD
ncbi:hypothetical protein [Kribbella sp. NPDC051770]|uniref:hypothetical protein n=1 Tax=Kribbella sp. NPDC051770 TaxID=3155413 RepID=UPI00343B5931